MASTSFYPHLNVGNIQKVSASTISSYTIPYSFDENAFYEDLVEAHDNEEALSVYKSLAQTFLDENSDAIASKSELVALIDSFDIFIEQLANGSTPTFDTEDFDLIAEKEKIWSNVLAHFVLKTSLGNDLNLALKLIALLENIQNETLDTELKILRFWKKTKIILPKPVFPLPKETVEVSEPTVPDADNTFNELIELRNSFTETRITLNTAYERQFMTQMINTTSSVDYAAALKLTMDEDFSKESNLRNANLINTTDKYNRYKNKTSLEYLDTTTYNSLDTEVKNNLKSLGFSGGADGLNLRLAFNKIDEYLGLISMELSKYSKPERVTMVGSSLVSIANSHFTDVICQQESTLSHCSLLNHLMQDNPVDANVQILGIGYANIIKQDLIRYQADEIAHIENIMARESKEKTHRNLKRNEETFFSESEKSNETETNNKTSDRFELSKEMNSVVAQSTQMNAGVTLTGGYGPVNVTANFGYASSSSSQDIANTATNHAKEVTQEAISRVQERVLERRSSTTLNEVEVTNVHAVNNTESGEHINSFYYWVDKVYSNQVHNMGKRLMLEFMIPEPAAYHVYSSLFSKKEGVTIDKPVNPKEYTGGAITAPIKTHRDIDRYNFHLWAAQYDVQDIPVPPQENTLVSKAYSMDLMPDSKLWHDKDFNDLVVPEGYHADQAFLRIAFSSGSGRYIHGHIGRKDFSVDVASAVNIVLDAEEGIVPFSFRGHFSEYAINVEILCKLSDIGYQKWQVSAFNSIMKAYEQKKSEYDNQVSSMEMGVMINGQNPRENRKTEKTELKKWAIELLTRQRFENFNAMLKASNGHPEIDFNKAKDEGSFVKFIEQSIEWNNMTYLFFPYFWAKKERWSTIKQFDDTDPIFAEFLKAGYARVVVPVHPKYTMPYYII